MATRYRVTRRQALRIGAAATALPLVHIRTAGAAGQGVDRLLGPLGTGRQRRHAEAGRCLGAEEPGLRRMSTSSPALATSCN